jgi:hypothetical protein
MDCKEETGCIWHALFSADFSYAQGPQGANKYSHIVGAASAVNKAFLPRVAAKLDVEQISEVVEVVSEDTFVRPIYAGNALATVQSADATKIFTIRSTNFEKAAAEGGSAAVEDFAAQDAGLSAFVGEELSKSDRPGRHHPPGPRHACAAPLFSLALVRLVWTARGFFNGWRS